MEKIVIFIVLPPNIGSIIKILMILTSTIASVDKFATQSLVHHAITRA